MTKICQQCQQSFEITDDDLKFYDEISPIFNGQKFPVSLPTVCPDCRLQRRMAFRNERNLYHRKCNLSGKQIISMYSPDKPYTVYAQEEWWSDKWDELSFGRDFDFTKTFSEQFLELYKAVPHIALYTKNVENSEYTSYTLNMKDCYLIFGGAHDEDCLYGHFISRCKDVVDCSSLYSCELCYEGLASEGCYDCSFFTSCRNCSECLMVESCNSCKNCLLCYGLSNKEYYILNKKVGKEEFQKKKQELFPLTSQKIDMLKGKLMQLKSTLPHRQSHIYNSENCTGDMIFNSKNCQYAFDITDCEDCKYICFTPKTTNSRDCTFASPDGVEFCYNTCSTVGTRSSMSTFLSWHNDSAYYCIECNSSEHIFGCTGLKHKQYCILNKQYSKENYEKTVSKIIKHMQKTGEWGEYFNPQISHFGYNETIAQEYFPLTEQQVRERNWIWQKEEEMGGSYLGPRIDIPASVQEVDESICDQILTCIVTGKQYKIIPQELKFYQRTGFPIPRKSPNQRHIERIARRNSKKLFHRKCAKCKKEIETTYAPERTETIYCESCYLNTVY